MLFNHYTINLLQQLQNPRNDLNYITFSGSCQLTIASTFFRPMLIFPSSIINPTKLVFTVKNLYFLIATSIYSFCGLFKTYLTYSLCSSLFSKQIIILSRYAIINLSRCSPNTLLIRFWNVAGAFISPNCITNSLYSPSFNLKAAFYLLPSLILI